MRPLTSSALLGAAWNYAGAAVLMAAQVASTAVTARVLVPREFGAYAAAQGAAGVFSYLALTGIGQDILRRVSVSPDVVGTAFVLTVTNGILVAASMWFLADAWAGLWHVSNAAPVIRVLALSLFLGASATVPVALLRRALRFRAAAIVETLSQVGGLCVGVVLAVATHSVIALGVGQSLTALALLASALVLTRTELRVAWRSAEARKLISFAGNVSALNAGFFFLYTSPSFVVARLFGAQALGFFSRANVILGLPLNYLTTGITKVMYPMYGRIGKEVVRTRALLTESVGMATGFIWPFLAIVAGGAPLVVRVLLGPGWSGSVDLLRLCALVAGGNLPWVLLTNAAEARGWMRLVWSRQLVYFLLLTGAVGAVALGNLGVASLLVGVACAQWLAYGLLVIAFVRRECLDARSVLSGHALHGLVALAAYAVASGCASALSGWPVVAQVAVQLLTFAALFFAILSAGSRYPATRILRARLAYADVGAPSRLLVRLGFVPSH